MNGVGDAGPKTRCQHVIDWATGAQVGALISYVDLGERMGVAKREHIQHAARRALRRLEDEHRRTLETVTGVGYRVADVRGHIRAGYTQSRKASRALTRGQSKVHSVNLAEVAEPELLRQVEVLRASFDDRLKADRRTQARLRREEKLFRGTEPQP